MTEDVRRIGAVDLVSEEALRQLAGHQEWPSVSVFMPTHRSGPETRQGPVRLRNLLDEAEAALAEEGFGARDADDLLAPARRLVDDTRFWQFQANGLAVFTAPGVFQRFRVPVELTEGVHVGAGFWLRPLLELVSTDGHFFVLALSQNDVRLYEGTRLTIAEVGIGATPTSMAEALALDDPENQLQVRSSGRTDAAGRSMFHGHGEGDEDDKEALERYFRAIDDGLEEILAGDRKPLVLASVGYYQPIFASVTSHPDLVDECVEGNPEHAAAEELHRGAWDIVERGFATAREAALERCSEALGAGRASDDFSEVVAAARHGRIETLVVPSSGTVWGAFDPTTAQAEVRDERRPGDVDLVEQAAKDTILTGGDVFVVDPDEMPGQGRVAALFRY